LGKVVSVSEEPGYVKIKFPDENLMTKLKFYGKTWGLLKDES